MVAPVPAAADVSLRARVGVLRKNPERVAWLVIYSAFAVCLLLTITVPLSVRYFLLYSTEARSGIIQAINLTQEGSSTVRVTPPNATQPIAISSEPRPFSENSWIETDQNSRAFLIFFDGSTGQVFPGSRVFIQEMRRPRFSWSELPNSIRIEQARGLVRYGTAMPVAHSDNPEGRAVYFNLRTPHFELTLTEGSYSVEVNEQGSQVVVREGMALVRSAGSVHEVTVAQGERLQVLRGRSLSDPLPAAQDLIRNGSFLSFTLAPDWQPFADQGGDGGDVNGSVGIFDVDDRSAVQILRAGADKNSAVTGIRQLLDRDVSDFRSLVFSAAVRLHYQSLSGGGYLSSEYPLIIRIRYRDVNGGENDWVHGFYYQNQDKNPTKNGELIPQDQWVPYETGNLLEGLDPRPFRILSITIYASGWDYESYIASVRLTVE